MNLENKQRLKEFLVKYPKVKDCIIKGDYNTLWHCFGFDGQSLIPRVNPLGDSNGHFNGSRVPNPLYGCLIMNALAELKIDCQLRKIPGYYANCPECAEFLDEIIIPKGVEIIEESAFWDCNNVTVINVPDSVKKIEESAFMSEATNRTVILPKKFEDKVVFNWIGIDSTDRVTFI